MMSFVRKHSYNKHQDMRSTTLLVVTSCFLLLALWHHLQTYPEPPVMITVTLSPISTTASVELEGNLDSELLRHFVAKFGGNSVRQDEFSPTTYTKHHPTTKKTTVITMPMSRTKYHNTHTQSHWTTVKTAATNKPRLRIVHSTRAVTHRAASHKHVNKVSCPSGLVVSVQDGGRLGNKLWEYAAVWSLSRLEHRQAFVPQAILDYLGRVFANLSLPAVESIQHCNLELGQPRKRYQISPLAKKMPYYRHQHLLLHKWIILPEPILKLRKHLREEFHFLPWIQKRVHETFSKFQRDNVTYVGVHVRRTDFTEYLSKEFNMSLVTKKYFYDAMNWFRRKLKTPLIFVVVSDDPEWCERELVRPFDDVVLAAKSGIASAGQDLAVLSSCNHSILDYGTFGMWGALMTGGHTITVATDEKLDAVLATDPSWHVWKIV